MDEDVRYQCIKIVNDLIKHKNSGIFILVLINRRAFQESCSLERK